LNIQMWLHLAKIVYKFPTLGYHLWHYLFYLWP